MVCFQAWTLPAPPPPHFFCYMLYFVLVPKLKIRPYPHYKGRKNTFFLVSEHFIGKLKTLRANNSFLRDFLAEISKIYNVDATILTSVFNWLQNKIIFVWSMPRKFLHLKGTNTTLETI